MEKEEQALRQRKQPRFPASGPRCLRQAFNP